MVPSPAPYAHRPAVGGAEASVLAEQAATVVMGRRRSPETAPAGALEPFRAVAAPVRGRSAPTLGRPGGAPDVGHALVVQVAKEGRNGPIHRNRQIPGRHQRLLLPGSPMERETPAAKAREVAPTPDGLELQGEGRVPPRDTAGFPAAIRAEGHRATGLQEAMVPGARVVLEAIGRFREVGEINGRVARPGGAYPSSAGAAGKGRPMVPLPPSTAGAQVGPGSPGFATPLEPHPGVTAALA